MVIDSLSFLNKAMIFFLILTSTGPPLLLIAASQSSLYSPTFSLQLSSIVYQEDISQLFHKSRLHQYLPLLQQNNVSSPFLNQVLSLLKGSDFLASFIALLALSSVFLKD